MIKHLHIPGRIVEGGWVIGGVSRLLDVWSPSPLILRSPPFRYQDFELQFSLTQRRVEPQQLGRRNKVKHKLSLSPIGVRSLSDSDIFYDCRHDSTGNVAHVLQNQIAVALTGLGAMEMSERWRDLVFIVHEQTPDYAVNLFETLGFRVMRNSRDIISGWSLTMEPAKFPLRAISSGVLRAHALEIGLLSDSDQVEDPVFVSRRGRRTLTNMEEVEPLINAAGYRTVYAEDLSSAEQIKTIARAERVIGLHGAALGYLMFRNPQTTGLVIECFSSGYATSWARAICSYVNDCWIGCQGDLDPDVISEMNGIWSPRKHESDSYSIDPHSMKTVLKIAEMSSVCPDANMACKSIEDFCSVEISENQLETIGFNV